MRYAKLTLAVLALAVLSFAVVHAPPATAAPIPFATSSKQADAGQPTAVTISKQSTYTTQCTAPACQLVFRYDGGTHTVSCSSDFNLPVSPDALTWQSAGYDRVQIVAADGGEPGCRFFLETKNVR